jgi:hypothetical protein
MFLAVFALAFGLKKTAAYTVDRMVNKRPRQSKAAKRG